MRSLLTMSSGVVFAETGSITSADWARDFFESEIRTEPGLKFAYNSMNTYILSEIVASGFGVDARRVPAPAAVRAARYRRLGLGKIAVGR